jgi:hypothetical protein
VFPARYELNSYIVFRKRLVPKRLKTEIPKKMKGRFVEALATGPYLETRNLQYTLFLKGPFAIILSSIPASSKWSLTFRLSN